MGVAEERELLGQTYKAARDDSVRGRAQTIAVDAYKGRDSKGYLLDD